MRRTDYEPTKFIICRDALKHTIKRKCPPGMDRALKQKVVGGGPYDDLDEKNIQRRVPSSL
jgi:hypothetical protein